MQHPPPHSRCTACAAVLLALLGMAAGAQAQAVPVATRFVESQDGIGHMLVVPYYTVQGGNATLLNITNSDRVNGKAVKVRFRGASNADDVFNFTLFLSPGDVWAAEISQNPATGLARLSTPDDSCTLPTGINRDFDTARLNPASDVANESREGYVEIITMADVVPGTAVHAATTHVGGKLPAACSQGASAPAALRALDTQTGVNEAGFSAPTSGLFANWSIFNVASATSWAGAATAIEAVDSHGVAGKGKVVVFPQSLNLPAGAVGELTSDPLLRSGAVVARQFDFPDLSTPYLEGTTPTQQASLLSGALAKSSVRNEFFIDKSVQAGTDWVMSLPTRRYSLALDYATGQPKYTSLPKAYITQDNVHFYAEGSYGTDMGCVFGIAMDYRNRSGQRMEPDFVLSASPVIHEQLILCGAVSVVTFETEYQEKDSVLASSVARDRQIVPQDPSAGWGEVRTPGLNNAGLPLIGAAFAKATSTNIGAGISGNFGLTWPHRYTRPSAGAQ